MPFNSQKMNALFCTGVLICALIEMVNREDLDQTDHLVNHLPQYLVQLWKPKILVKTIRSSHAKQQGLNLHVKGQFQSLLWQDELKGKHSLMS